MHINISCHDKSPANVLDDIYLLGFMINKIDIAIQCSTVMMEKWKNKHSSKVWWSYFILILTLKSMNG